MSELREWTADEIEEYDDARLELAEDGKIDCTRVYIKSEADKVIADLEESHKVEVKQLLILNREQANSANRLRDDMERVIRHQKYKRCLAMAKWCTERIARIEKDYAFWRYGKDYASNFYKRWKKRWLELAEKFKEAK